jgi:hypothetical protein
MMYSMSTARDWDSQPFVAGGLPPWFCFSGCAADKPAVQEAVVASTVPGPAASATPAAGNAKIPPSESQPNTPSPPQNEKPAATAAKPLFVLDLATLHPDVRTAVQRARESRSIAERVATQAREAAQKGEDAFRRAQNREEGYRFFDGGTGRIGGQWASGINGFGMQELLGDEFKGDRYAGQFKNARTDGLGVYEIGRPGADPHLQIGEFSDSHLKGFGIISWKSGSQYLGSTGEGILNGYGVFEWPNGQRYEGGFSKGRKDGFGIQLAADGRLQFAAEWKDGALVRQLSLPRPRN